MSSQMRRRIARCLGAVAFLWVVIPAVLPAKPVDQISFGAEMAGRGLWSEALFRFRQAAKAEPNNPRIHNNIAVCLEALGLYDEAMEEYRLAIEKGANLEEAKRNYARFVEFYQAYRGGLDGDEVSDEGDSEAESEEGEALAENTDDEPEQTVSEASSDNPDPSQQIGGEA